MNIRIVTPPVIEPVTLDYVKKHSRIKYDIEDAILALWIRSAREQAENIMGQSLITQTWEVSYDIGVEDYPYMPIPLPRSPVQIVSSIKTYDTLGTESSLLLTDFDIDTHSIPARIDLGYCKSWPTTTLRSTRSIVINYICGYGNTTESIPADIRDAILLYCTHRNENRADESGMCAGFMNLLFRKRLYVR